MKINVTKDECEMYMTCLTEYCNQMKKSGVHERKLWKYRRAFGRLHVLLQNEKRKINKLNKKQNGLVQNDKKALRTLQKEERQDDLPVHA